MYVLTIKKKVWGVNSWGGNFTARFTIPDSSLLGCFVYVAIRTCVWATQFNQRALLRSWFTPLCYITKMNLARNVYLNIYINTSFFWTVCTYFTFKYHTTEPFTGIIMKYRLHYFVKFVITCLRAVWWNPKLIMNQTIYITLNIFHTIPNTVIVVFITLQNLITSYYSKLCHWT